MKFNTLRTAKVNGHNVGTAVKIIDRGFKRGATRYPIYDFRSECMFEKLSTSKNLVWLFM